MMVFINWDPHQLLGAFNSIWTSLDIRANVDNAAIEKNCYVDSLKGPQKKGPP